MFLSNFLKNKSKQQFKFKTIGISYPLKKGIPDIYLTKIYQELPVYLKEVFLNTDFYLITHEAMKKLPLEVALIFSQFSLFEVYKYIYDIIELKAFYFDLGYNAIVVKWIARGIFEPNEKIQKLLKCSEEKHIVVLCPERFEDFFENVIINKHKLDTYFNKAELEKLLLNYFISYQILRIYLNQGIILKDFFQKEEEYISNLIKDSLINAFLFHMWFKGNPEKEKLFSYLIQISITDSFGFFGKDLAIPWLSDSRILFLTATPFFQTHNYTVNLKLSKDETFLMFKYIFSNFKKKEIFPETKEAIEFIYQNRRNKEIKRKFSFIFKDYSLVFLEKLFCDYKNDENQNFYFWLYIFYFITKSNYDTVIKHYKH